MPYQLSRWGHASESGNQSCPQMNILRANRRRFALCPWYSRDYRWKMTAANGYEIPNLTDFRPSCRTGPPSIRFGPQMNTKFHN